MQAVSSAGSQLLQPLLALASAPHMPLLPWRNADPECTPAMSEQDTPLMSEQDTPLMSEHDTQPMLEQDTPPMSEGNMPKSAQQHTMDSLQQETAAPSQQDHPNPLMQATCTASRQTPVSVRKHSQALMQEMLESPVTVSKPVAQPGHTSSFRRQSKCGMQGLTYDSAEQLAQDATSSVEQGRMGDCHAVRAQSPAGLTGSVAGAAKASESADCSGDTAQGPHSIDRVDTLDQALAATPADACHSTTFSLPALESSCACANDPCRSDHMIEAQILGAYEHRSEAVQPTYAPEELPVSESVAAVCVQQSQSESEQQVAVETALCTITNAESQAQANRCGSEASSDSVDRLGAASAGMLAGACARGPLMIAMQNSWGQYISLLCVAVHAFGQVACILLFLGAHLNSPCTSDL